MFYYDITCAPCFQPSVYGYSNSFFILFWTFSTGLFFSAFIVSQLLYSKRSPFYIYKSSHLHELHPDSDSDSDSSVQQVMYTDFFPLNNNNHNIPGDNTHIIENTPNGNVIMSYSQSEEGFIYYADNNIPFDVLETVARKFCNSFDCGGLYLSRKNTHQEQESVNESENESEKLTVSETQTEFITLHDSITDNNVSPFASLKNYNSNTNMNPSPNNSTTHCATACKFVRKGKINDFKPIIHSPSPTKKISFKDFKTSL